MSLYQKIRPTEWCDVVGNNSVIGALRGLAKRKPEDRPHSIMLIGPKGCGKTTLARILAREFGTTSSGLFEYNAASVGGIETAREIISHMSLYAIGGGSKCYIFDEAHQLTSAAQEALLKATEETPEHCYIIFCTTDPEKIKPTLRNRFTTYEVNPLSSNNILTILEGACKIKKLSVSVSILETIACNCDGCPRTSLVLLEKVQDIEEEEAISLLIKEIDSHSEIFDVCRMLIRKPELRQKSWKKILSTFNSVKETDSEQLRYAILGFLLQQLNYIGEEDLEYVEDIVKLMEVFSTNTFYGKKKQLICLLLKACFMK